MPNPNPESPIDTPYIELANLESNLRQPEIPAPAEIPNMAAAPVYATEIYIHSQGYITALLANANPEPMDPHEARLQRNLRNDEGCTSHRLENSTNGAACGGGLGLIMKVTCGSSLLSAIGCAGFWATFFFCYNPPLLRDCLQTQAAQAQPRRN